MIARLGSHEPARDHDGAHAAVAAQAAHTHPLWDVRAPTEPPVSVLPDAPLILVALDFSSASHAALAWALAHAQSTLAPVHTVHVAHIPPPDLPAARLRSMADSKLIAEVATSEWSKLTPGVRARLPPPEQHVRNGHPLREILACAKELAAGLLVLGSHGHTGLERLLVGSVTERVARMAECPVVIIKKPPSPTSH